MRAKSGIRVDVAGPYLKVVVKGRLSPAFFTVAEFNRYMAEERKRLKGETGKKVMG